MKRRGKIRKQKGILSKKESQWKNTNKVDWPQHVFSNSTVIIYILLEYLVSSTLGSDDLAFGSFHRRGSPILFDSMNITIVTFIFTLKYPITY